jgi:hypothetical protein
MTPNQTICARRNEEKGKVGGRLTGARNRRFANDVEVWDRSQALFSRDGRFPAAGRGELRVMQQRRGTMRGAFSMWIWRRMADRGAPATR